jgi:hypothetical protein
MICTNPNTYAFMSYLNQAVELAQTSRQEFAIIPDAAAFWVKAPAPIRLPAVWPIAGELSTPKLMGRFIQAMESSRSTTIFIVQKVEADTLATDADALHPRRAVRQKIYNRRRKWGEFFGPAKTIHETRRSGFILRFTLPRSTANQRRATPGSTPQYPAP